MMPPPDAVGPIHFIGIGGIGMSGIAEVLALQGYRVQGSDAAEGYTLDRLRGLGVTVFVGHQASNVAGAAVVVMSSAIKDGNPELAAARAAGLPIAKRAEMLAELMKPRRAIAVAGTHGKTTTTTMVAALVEAGGLDPSVINGGIINAYGSNAKLGQGAWMIAEADESDGTFLKLPAEVAVVTNVDPEHLDHFKTYDAVKTAFRSFIENVPFYGFAVVCADHAETMAIAASVRDRRVLSYGFAEGADVRALNLAADRDGMTFDVMLSARLTGGAATLSQVRLPMPGKHNVLNALAAIAVARELGVADADAVAGLAGFEGVQRRFTKVGSWNGVTIIDDYSHNPPKIAAAIEAARQVAEGRVIAVMQPHRFTRVRDLFDGFVACLDGADVAIVSDVYTAGEAPIEGITGAALVEAMKAHGHGDARYLPSPDDLPGLIHRVARPGDYVIVLGAGSNTTWAKKLPGQLEALG
ncbi:UDP-N-acetylmuramate--L-alanine ligase [Alphaproteobacteria bacterium SO-S41]|nr:UDP-N-acetylmuramate--L-alanine ligase [Alphaproteobacteria bacterium SO-S41]